MKKLNKDESLQFIKEIHKDFEAMKKYYTKVSKKDSFYKLGTGEVIQLERSDISKKMYYDDEYEGPDPKNYKAFESYNLFYNFNLKFIEEWLEMEESLKNNGCCSGLHSHMYLMNLYKNEKRVSLQVFRDVSCDNAFIEPHEYKYFLRYLTAEEEKEVIKIYQQEKEVYTKRLKLTSNATATR